MNTNTQTSEQLKTPPLGGSCLDKRLYEPSGSPSKTRESEGVKRLLSWVGPHFKLSEFTRSDKAVELGIDNTPTEYAKRNLQRLCEQTLEPLRDVWGAPIIVSSGYRSPELNKAIKGATNSDHMYGCAADIHTVSNSKADNKRLFILAMQLMQQGKINIKQLIDEKNYKWIHISFQDGRTSKKNQVLHLL